MFSFLRRNKPLAAGGARANPGGGGTPAAGPARFSPLLANLGDGTPVWISIDPRSGGLRLYPQPVVDRLEQTLRAGNPHVVPLAGLGMVYESLAIDLGELQQVNHATRGKRDVRRYEVQSGATELTVTVVKERNWKIANFPVAGLTEERQVALNNFDEQGGSLLTAPAKRPEKVNPARSPEEMAAELEARAAAIIDGDLAGFMALWEWCQLAGNAGEDAPDEMWGIYAEDQDKTIEQAFRDGKPSIAVSVGIRSYEVVFDGASGGKQIDHALKKKRWVRRRLVSPRERDAAFKEASAAAEAETADLEECECAICCTGFRETPSMPVVRLPGCGHVFHGACVQHLADKKGLCPFCRAEVDWVTAFAPKARNNSALAEAAARDAPKAVLTGNGHIRVSL